jgi:hypothetical protein
MVYVYNLTGKYIKSYVVFMSFDSTTITEISRGDIGSLHVNL